MEPSDLHIGTSGWSYKHWSGIFYPEDIRPAKYLEYYVNHFECVELNSCFYNLPRESTVKSWIERTPGNFRICPKMSRYITHDMQLAGIEEALGKFIGVFALMKEKIGPVLIQLPPQLLFDRSLIVSFFELLKSIGKGFRYSVEVRNKSWINDDFINILVEYNIGFVIADSGGRYPYQEAVTTDFVYLRLHGREQLYATDYDEATLNEFAVKIKGWLSSGKDVWVFFNNDFHGYAVKNAKQLISMNR